MSAPEQLRPNGHTIRTFEQDGYQVSEIEFIIEDYGPAIGYMIGPDDGFTPLERSADDAVRARKAREATT